MNTENLNPGSNEIKTQIYQITYEGNTINIMPLVSGRFKNGTEILIAEKVIHGSVTRIVVLSIGKIRRPRRVSKAIHSRPMPRGYVNQLGAVDGYGTPTGWKPFTELPKDRVKGYDPTTKVVDTTPTRMTIYQN